MLLLSGAVVSAQTVTWLGGSGEYTDAENWSSGQTPSVTTPVRISSGNARVEAGSLFRSSQTVLNGGGLEIQAGSFLQGGSASAALNVSDGSFRMAGPEAVLSDWHSATVRQTGGEISMRVGNRFHFSRRSGRSATVRMEGGLWEVDYTGNTADPFTDYQMMGRGGTDVMILDDGHFRIIRSGSQARRIDILGNSSIEISGGVFEVRDIHRFSVGRDLPGEALVTVNGGEFLMLNTQADAGGIVLGDYTHGRMRVRDGRVQVTPALDGSPRVIGLVIGRKGKADTGRSRGTLLQSGGEIDLEEMNVHLGDVGRVLTYGYGGRGTYVMTGGRLRARNVRTWDGGEFVVDEPGDSHFFFYQGEVVLWGDQRDWPDQAFVVTSSAINREYDPQTNLTRLTATPPVSQPVTYRHYRFTPVRRRGGGADVEMVQLAEFRFFLEGAPVDTTGVVVTNPGGRNPAGEEPFRVMDGDPQSKWLDFERQPLIFSFPQPVTVDAYSMTTANDFPDRDLLRWTLEGSHDGIHWELLDRMDSNYPVPRERFAETLPFSLSASVPPEIVRTPEILRYLRFVPLAARDPGASHVQLSRLEFYRDERRIFPEGIVALAEDGTTAAQRNHSNDGRVRTAWRAPLANGGLRFDFGSAVELDGFLLAHGGNTPEEDPVRWRMERSLDGSTWSVLDDRSLHMFASLSRRYAVSGILPFRAPPPPAWREWTEAWSGVDMLDPLEIFEETGAPKIWSFVHGHTPDRPMTAEPFSFIEAGNSGPVFRVSRSENALSAGGLWLETSSDLVHWIPIELPAASTGHVQVAPDPEAAGMETVTIFLPGDSGSEGVLFARLRFQPVPEILP